MAGSLSEEAQMSRGKLSEMQKYGAPLVLFASAVLLLFASWLLWETHDNRAQGAAIALVGVVASHLIKEVQELLKAWMRPGNPDSGSGSTDSKSALPSTGDHDDGPAAAKPGPGQHPQRLPAAADIRTGRRS